MKKNIDLLKGNILSSLTELALPIMATAMVQMAYSLTDMAWIGRVGSSAVAAVGAGSMYTWLSQGVVSMAKMGGQIKVSHSLGSGNSKDAVQYAKGALQMGIMFAFVFAFICVTAAGPLIGFFRLPDPAVIADAKVYLQITCGLILFSFLNIIFTGILTATGDSKTPFLANVVGLAVNMILDPVLIFGMGPFPKMGVAGAAAATVFAQAIVTVVFLLMIRKDKVVFDKVRILERTAGYYYKTIIRLGLPAAVQNLLYTSISMILTRFVSGFGVAAVAVMRVGSQVESISWMTADGFSAAINSFIGQNFGAGQHRRVKKGYMTAIIMMGIWGLFSSTLLICFPRQLFGLFIHEADVLLLGVDYLVVLGFSQMFMCVEQTTVGSLSGLGKTFLCSIISVILTSARIPLAWFLSSTSLGLNGIWWAYTISSVAKGIVFFLCFLLVMKKLPQDRQRE